MASAPFAKGLEALGVCDNCSFTVKHRLLKPTSYGTLVCETCYDGQFDVKNHPQNGPFPVTPDPIAIRNPRPEVNLVPGAAQDSAQQMPASQDNAASWDA